MFPNGQSALPLPQRPSIEHYKKLAKDLVKAGKSGSIGNWAETHKVHELEEFALLKLSEKCTLSRAQFVIARSYGFESWPKFVHHLEGLTNNSPVSRFEAAADAIVTGEIGALKGLLREDPNLVHTSSTREHGATLLHYVAANGVEMYRQKTPKNIVEITELLLQAGAEVDAFANVYDGGCTTLGLAATSIHPVRAGVLDELLQTLLDHQANVTLASVASCLGNGRPRAAEILASKGARLDLAGAGGIGRLDVVEDLFDTSSLEQRAQGFVYACEYGRCEVVEFMLKKDASLVAQMAIGQTGLHMAVIGAHLNIVELLLRHKAPLEAKNRFGGTVFGQALWCAAHGGDTDTYIAILGELIGAGAKVPEVHVPVNDRVDAWLIERGSRAEPNWYWQGERPRGQKNA